MTNERAIKWLQMYLSKPIKWDNYSNTTKDIRDRAEKEIFEAFRMAFSALRKQIPIEPIIDMYWETPSVYDNDVKVTENKCGACGAVIDKWDKYCRICGRPVKWNA